MSDLLPTLVVFVIGLAGAVAWSRRFPVRERSLLLVSFGAHVLAAFAQVWVTRGYYGIGDMMLYHETGVELARLIRFNPSQFLPDVASMLVHGTPQLPVLVIGAGGSSGVPSALAGILLSVLNDSIYALCLVIAVATYFGKGALYRVLREELPAEVRTRVLIGCMLIPSVVFWSSAILKEAVAMITFGWVVFGWHRFLTGRRISGLLIAAAAAYPIAMVKAYILMALVIALGVWWYWRRASEASTDGVVLVKPIYFALGVAGAAGAILLLGDLFPRYSLDNISEEAARLQSIGTTHRGGSTYQIADSTQRSLAGQIAFAPVALLTALFRPLIFEVRNAPMLVNALETTALTLVFVSAVVRRSWAQVWLEVRRTPALMFALTFVLLFGVAVGLASTNLGSLSRYRIPLVPFFAVFVLVLAVAGPRRVPARTASVPRMPRPRVASR